MNVLLVDDVPLIIEALKSLIDWKSYGFDIRGEAFDGSEALEIIRNTKIDLMITDIKMPVMDGLELIKRAKEIQENMSIVVLSSYDEFELVRQAFKIGASDYILKLEMDPDRIASICRRIREELEKEAAGKRTMEERDKQIEEQKKAMEETIAKQKSLENQLFFGKGIIRDKLFRELLSGRYAKKEEIVSRFRELELEFIHGKVVLLVVVLENINLALEEKWDGDQELLSFSICNIIDELLVEYDSTDVFCINREEYGIVFPADATHGWKVQRERFASIYRDIRVNLRDHLGLQVSAGVSRNQYGLEQLPKLYSQVKFACQYRFIAGKEKLIAYDEIPTASRETDLKQKERLEYLRAALQSLDAGIMKKSLALLLIRDTEVPAGGMNVVREIYEKYSWVLIDFIEQNGMYRQCEELILKYRQYMWNMGSIKELNQWLTDMFQKAIEGLKAENRLVYLARQYIHKHYSEDISLKTVAEALEVSSGHISRIFLKEMDVSFVDYLNSYRIEQAKGHMKAGNLKIYEIAGKVGYNNVEHFTRVFKRYVGKSPKEYIQICHRDM